MFNSTHADSTGQDQSLEDYVTRMKPEQEKIYYLVAESEKAAKNSPHLEIFRKKGIEVLLLSDRIDDWLMSHLHEFDGKSLQDITRGELDLGKLDDTDEDKAEQEEREKALQPLLERVSKSLGDRIKETRISHRLTDSPACLALSEDDMGAQMRRIMEASSWEISLLFDQASLADGNELEDPARFSRQLNKLLLELAQ